jgi:transposase-like protein
MAVSFKGAHFPKDIILTGVRWYVAYPLSTRHVEERFCRKVAFSRVWQSVSR